MVKAGGSKRSGNARVRRAGPNIFLGGRADRQSWTSSPVIFIGASRTRGLAKCSAAAATGRGQQARRLQIIWADCPLGQSRRRRGKASEVRSSGERPEPEV
eukprot:SAG31_NODE_805_length_11970_cov_3.710793_13_plen_101_part_00